MSTLLIVEKLNDLDNKMAKYVKELNKIHETSKFLTIKLLQTWELHNELLNNPEKITQINIDNE